MGWRRGAFMALVLTQTILLVGSVDRFDGATGYLHVDGQTFPVHYLPPRDYEQAWSAHPDLTSRIWYGEFTHGFTVNGHIYIRDGPLANEPQLLAHELGHILGHRHTLEPTTMNPWGVFRLNDDEGLVPLVEEGYEPPTARSQGEPNDRPPASHSTTSESPGDFK